MRPGFRATCVGASLAPLALCAIILAGSQYLVSFDVISIDGALVGLLVISLWFVQMACHIRHLAWRRKLLEAWAASHNYRLISMRADPLLAIKEILSGRMSHLQMLRRVIVADASGRTRFGRALIGEHWLGMLKPKIQVDLDENDGLEFDVPSEGKE